MSDTAIICLAVFVAFLARFWWEESGLGSLATGVAGMGVAITMMWAIMLGVYKTRDKRIVGLGISEYRRVVNASLVSFGLLAIGFVIFKVEVARGFFVLALPLGAAGLLVNRWLWRKWLAGKRRRGEFVSRAIVVGSPADVQHVVRQINRLRAAPYTVVGVAIDGVTRDGVVVAGQDIPVVADLDAVADVAAATGVDAVIVAGQPSGGGNYIRDLGWDLEGSGAELVLASRLTNVAGPRIHFRPVEGLPLMHVELPQYEGGKHVLKRALDASVSGMLLVLLALPMLVIALLVRADSRGPVFFHQERVGRGGHPFRMLKFRTMVDTAEDDLAGLLDKNEGAGVLFKMKNDPRVTPVGRILRKHSLDELPQLWNVLRGEMSLVGPRPPLQREVDRYEERVHRRLYIKPGLTGMWQVSGRSNLDWDESVRLDLYYVENWSLAGDLVIMWRTLRVLVNSTGAY